jgi:hypothetical protein
MPHIAASALAFAGEEEFFEEEAGEEGGVVADDAMLLKEIVTNDADAELEEFVAIKADGVGTFGAITPGDVRGNGLGVSDDDIDDATADVLLDGAKMIAEGIVGSFAGLGHQVGDVHPRGLRMNNGAGNFGDQEIGNDAGIKGAGAHKDEVGIFDGFDRTGKRANAAGVERELSNGKLAAGDAGFAVKTGAVGERGDKVDVRKR